jgi:hypothetical protein
MAHGIYTDRDFQVAEQVAWHKLTRIAKPTLEHFPLIEPMPLFYNEGTVMSFGDKVYVVPVASDDKLPVAPPYCEGTYTLFTPREAWSWVTEVLAGTGYDIKSIGMLWNRSFWFISTELTELKSLSIGDGRETNFMLNFSGGLDRKVSPQCELSGIVAVCHNTISLSRISGKVLFHERATKNFQTRLEAAKSEVGEAVGMAAVFKAAMDSLAQKPCTKERAERVFAGYITPEGETRMGPRTKNQVAELTSLHVRGIGNKGESEFDLLNAYTEFMTHGASDSKIPMGRRFASSEYGNAADAKADFATMLGNSDRSRLEATEERGDKILLAMV